MTESSTLLEARRLLKLIDPYKLNEKDFKFVKGISSKIDEEIELSDNVIYMLRDIKDRQLESEA